MSYSDFDLYKVLKTFDLAYSEIVEIFTPLPELECSRLLTETLLSNLGKILGILALGMGDGALNP